MIGLKSNVQNAELSRSVNIIKKIQKIPESDLSLLIELEKNVIWAVYITFETVVIETEIDDIFIFDLTYLNKPDMFLGLTEVGDEPDDGSTAGAVTELHRQN